MGYTVEYTPQHNSKYPLKKDGRSQFRKTLYGILACAALAALLWLHRKGILREMLIPGDADVTEAAARKMMEGVRQGDGVYRSLRTFCQDILLHAQVY